MGRLKKTALIFCLLVILIAPISKADLYLSDVVLSDGLDESGYPNNYQKKFILSEDQGVQYFLKLASKEKKDIKIKWFDPEDRLINLFELNNYKGKVIRDYIGFEAKSNTQIIIPEKEGEYSIYLYLNQELKAITRFKLVK